MNSSLAEWLRSLGVGPAGGNLRSTARALRTAAFLGAVLVTTACKEQILHNLNEAEANRYLTGLHDARIVAEKVKQADGHWALAVEQSDAVQAIKALEDRRLFRGEGAVPQKSSVISSREDQRFRFERALAREVENTLASIDGVLEARVHLNMPPTDPLFGTPLKNAVGSASVLLVVRADFGLPSDEIAQLVSGASGIERKAVSVLVNRAQRPTEEAVNVPAGTAAEISEGAAVAQVVARPVQVPQVAVKEVPSATSPVYHEHRSGVLAFITSSLGVQIICSVLILVGGGVWVAISRRRSAKVVLLAQPLLKAER